MQMVMVLLNSHELVESRKTAALSKGSGVDKFEKVEPSAECIKIKNNEMKQELFRSISNEIEAKLVHVTESSKNQVYKTSCTHSRTGYECTGGNKSDMLVCFSRLSNNEGALVYINFTLDPSTIANAFQKSKQQDLITQIRQGEKRKKEYGEIGR